MNPALRLMAARTAAAASFDPRTDVAWHTAVWADDPDWSNPGDGNAVSSWRDASGNSRTLSQSTGSYQPVFRSSVAGLNNRAAVDFDGTDDHIGTADFTVVNQTISLVWIGKRDGASSGSNYRAIDCYGASSPFTSMFARDGTGKWSCYAGSAFGDSTVSYDTSGVALRTTLAGASSAIVVNGTSTTISPGTGGAKRLDVGGSRDYITTAPLNCHVGFAALYDGDVTADGGWSGFVSWVSSYYGLTIA